MHVSLTLAMLVPLVVVLSGPLKSSAQTVEIPRVQDSEEYAVYNAILVQFESAKPTQIVINSSTNSQTTSAFVGVVCGLAPSGAKRPDVDADTASDFDTKNAKTSLLDRQFDSKIPYALVTDQELRAIFDERAAGRIDPDSWTRFYQRYPGAPGILAFSRVGFNTKKNQALVYAVLQHGCLGGSGRFLVLTKDDKPWKVQKTVVVWLS